MLPLYSLWYFAYKYCKRQSCECVVENYNMTFCGKVFRKKNATLVKQVNLLLLEVKN